MRFHIVGIGPSGSLLAFHLRRKVPKQNDIILVHKSAGRAANLRQNRDRIQVEYGGAAMSATGFKHEAFDIFNEIASDTNFGQRNPEEAVKTPFYDPSESANIDSLFICTKAYAVFQIIKTFLPRISPRTTVVLMNNGMGVYEELIYNTFRNPQSRPHFIIAANSHGSWQKSYGHVVHAGQGLIDFGIIPDTRMRDFEKALLDTSLPQHERRLRLNDITNPENDPDTVRYATLRGTVEALLAMNGLNTAWRPMSEMQVYLRRKLVVNSVINPLTALMDCRNGDIFVDPHGQNIMSKVCAEASEVFRAEHESENRAWMQSQGLNPDSNPDTASTSTDDTQTSPPSQSPILETALAENPFPVGLQQRSLEGLCLQVSRKTASNLSSMLVDVRLGRRTEIDFLNGYLLNLGSTYGVQMPANQMLRNLIKMRMAIPKRSPM